MNKSDKIKANDPTDQSGIFHIISNTFDFFPFKLAMIVFFVFMLISSDVFTSRVLKGIDGAVGYSDTVTDKGTIILGLILVLAVFAGDFLIKTNII